MVTLLRNLKSEFDNQEFEEAKIELSNLEHQVAQAHINYYSSGKSRLCSKISHLKNIDCIYDPEADGNKILPTSFICNADFLMMYIDTTDIGVVPGRATVKVVPIVNGIILEAVEKETVKLQCEAFAIKRVITREYLVEGNYSWNNISYDICDGILLVRVPSCAHYFISQPNCFQSC